MVTDPKSTDHKRFEAPAGHIGPRFLHGIAVTGAAQGVRVVCQLISTVVLGRLLLPSDFGLIAMAGPIVAFVYMFADLGLSQAAVQTQGLTHGQSTALFWLSLFLAAALAILLATMSPVVGWFYGDRRAGYVCATLGFSLMISALGSQHTALLTRGMRFSVLAAIDAVGAILGLVSAVLAALFGAGYWSLVIAAFVSTLVPTIWVWAVVDWRPSLDWKNSQVKPLLSFGAGITGFNVANFFSRNLDNVLVGRRWGPEQLGLYDRAYKLLLFPLAQVTSPVARVMIPTLARLATSPLAYKEAFLNVLSQTLLVTVPGVMLLICTAERAIPFLMGDRWIGVIPIFLAFATAALVQPLNNPTGWLFITQGRTKEYAAWGVFGAISNVIAFLIGLPYGAFGVAIAYAAAELIRTPVLWWLVTRRGPVTVIEVVGVVIPQIVSALAVFAVLQFINSLSLRNNLPYLSACTVATVTTAMLVNLGFPTARRRMLRTVHLINKAIGIGAHS